MVELLVAMAVLIVMVGLFAQAVGGISSAWQTAQHRMDNYTKARALLSRLQSDMDGMVVRPDLFAFQENSSTGAKTDFSFYTMRRGVSPTAEVNPGDRPLSYVEYFTEPDEGRLIRKDVSYTYDVGDQLNFSAASVAPAGGTAPVNTAPGPWTVPDTNTTIGVADGVLGFTWAFLRQDGKFSPTFYYKDGNVTRTAMGIAVALLVLDEKNAINLKEMGKLENLVHDISSHTPQVHDGDETWSPKDAWDIALGNKVGEGGELARNFGNAPFIRGIRAFERVYIFPNTNTL